MARKFAPTKNNAILLLAAASKLDGYTIDDVSTEDGFLTASDEVVEEAFGKSTTEGEVVEGPTADGDAPEPAKKPAAKKAAAKKSTSARRSQS